MSKYWWVGDPFMKKFFLEKVSQCRKKPKGRTLWGFPTTILSQNRKKIWRGTLWGIFFPEKKSHNAEKNWKGGNPLVSPGMVCYAGKQEKPFWFSSLGQMVQFGSIIFCSRTFVELFWSVQVVLKKHWRKAMTIVDSFLKKSADKNCRVIKVIDSECFVQVF